MLDFSLNPMSKALALTLTTQKQTLLWYVNISWENTSERDSRALTNERA